MDEAPEVLTQAAESAALQRRAGWWAWPVILLAPVLMLVSDSLLPVAEAEAEGQHDASLLAMFQVQSKLVIAAAATRPGEARQQLATLEAYARSDENTAALALVHGFIGLDRGGREAVDLLLAKRADEPGADSAFLEEVRQAVFHGVDESARDRLASRVGWFSRLAGTPGNPGEAPEGDAIRRSALVQALVFLLAFFAGLIAVFLGAGLLLFAEIRRVGGKLRLAFDRSRLPSGVLLEVFALFLLSMALGNLAGWMIHWSAQPAISLSGLVFALCWPRLRGIPWQHTRRALGWHRGQGIFREIGAGILGYLTVLPMAVMGVAMSALLVAGVKAFARGGEGERVPGSAGTGELLAEPVTHPAVGWMLGGWEAKILVFVLAAVLAPLVEELFFRGAFYRHLRFRLNLWGAGLLNGLLFAALHPQGWMAIPALTMMGFGFACLREWRDSLIAPMTAHAINNGVLIGGLALVLG